MGRDQPKNEKATGPNADAARLHCLAQLGGLADDAWIACLVTLESLGDPALTPTEAKTRLAGLAAQLARFNAALQPIMRLCGVPEPGGRTSEHVLTSSAPRG